MDRSWAYDPGALHHMCRSARCGGAGRVFCLAYLFKMDRFPVCGVRPPRRLCCHAQGKSNNSDAVAQTIVGKATAARVNSGQKPSGKHFGFLAALADSSPLPATTDNTGRYRLTAAAARNATGHWTSSPSLEAWQTPASVARIELRCGMQGDNKKSRAVLSASSPCRSFATQHNHGLTRHHRRVGQTSNTPVTPRPYCAGHESE